MTGNMSSKDDFYSENDALDINELASLNEDITAEFIEQLQNKVSQTAMNFSEKNVSDDSELFEDVKVAENIEKTSSEDDFIKKYQAKNNKQKIEEQVVEAEAEQVATTVKEDVEQPIASTINQDTESFKEPEIEVKSKKTKSEGQIEGLTGGNIVERPIDNEQLKYNESLDYIDDNVKYSKYIIYIDPQNKEFIDSLTVKERKNLINRIIREQDDIAITKKRLGIIQTFIKHTIVAIITIALAIPIIYQVINASLEASINNYRRSQSIFKTLYKEKGKIQKNQYNR